MQELLSKVQECIDLGVFALIVMVDVCCSIVMWLPAVVLSLTNVVEWTQLRHARA